MKREGEKERSLTSTARAGQTKGSRAAPPRDKIIWHWRTGNLPNCPLSGTTSESFCRDERAEGGRRGRANVVLVSSWDVRGAGNDSTGASFHFLNGTEVLIKTNCSRYCAFYPFCQFILLSLSNVESCFIRVKVTRPSLLVRDIILKQWKCVWNECLSVEEKLNLYLAAINQNNDAIKAKQTKEVNWNLF